MAFHPSVVRVSLFALAVAALAVSTACGATIKSINFTVDEGGQKVQVDKFFNDGLGGDNPAAHAFIAAQQGDVPKAIGIMKADIATNPKDVWDHYDLAILYEATAEWDKAEVEMKDAQRLDNEASKGHPNSRFPEELTFIEKHKKR